MGAKTLTALAGNSAVYFHAVGGTAAVIAEHIECVLDVLKPEFGMPEAMWVLQVRDVPLFVTMDAHGSSLHATVREASRTRLRRLLQDD
jgi:tartrate dehydratase beta subunit/fumarate hydratase class I family protein